MEIKDFLFARLNRVDCHVNLVGKNALKEHPDFAEDSIIFVDNDIKNTDEPLIPYFEKIDTRLQSGRKYHISYIGKDVEETKKLVDTYPVEFIGEVKCFKHYKDSENVEHTHENFSIAICEDFKDIPMFVHIDLIDERSVGFLKEILELNEERPVILCHCGMNDLDDKKYAFEQAIALQHKYNNLYLEISWVAWDWFDEDHRRMSLVDTDRLLLGSDLSKFDYEPAIVSTMNRMDYWERKMNIRRNINKILNLTGQYNPMYNSLYN